MQNLNCKQSYLPNIVGATDSTLDLLVDGTYCCHSAHFHGSRGNRSLSVQSFHTPRMVYASRVIGWYHRVFLLWHHARPSVLLGDPILWPAYPFPPWYACHVLGLEFVFTPTLDGDHLLNENRSSTDCE